MVVAAAAFGVPAAIVEATAANSGLCVPVSPVVSSTVSDPSSLGRVLLLGRGARPASWRCVAVAVGAAVSAGGAKAVVGAAADWRRSPDDIRNVASFLQGLR